MRVNILECLPPSQKQFFCLDFWLCVVSECTFYYNGYKNYKVFFFKFLFCLRSSMKGSCCFSLITASKELILCIVDCCLFNTTTRTVLQVQCQNSYFQRCAVFPRCFISIPRAPNKHGWVCIYFFFPLLKGKTCLGKSGLKALQGISGDCCNQAWELVSFARDFFFLFFFLIWVIQKISLCKPVFKYEVFMLRLNVLWVFWMAFLLWSLSFLVVCELAFCQNGN